ncbi:MAG: amidohydrolase family protein [Gammaproteobacteria bacterium]
MARRLFSVDDHIIEPPDVWADRLPEKYKGSGPRVVEVDGRQGWNYEDQRIHSIGLNAVAGLPPEQWGTDPVRYDAIQPACYDPRARAEGFRRDGIVASMAFPDMPGFAGHRFTLMKDKALADLCVKAFNDWVFDEWCAAAPDLFVPLNILQLWDPALAAAEVRRCAARGCRSVAFPEQVTNLGLPSFHSRAWDPLWQALEETGVVVSIHGGASGPVPLLNPDSHLMSPIIGGGTALGGMLITDLMTSRVLREFRNLKFIVTEGGIGFLPYLLERADLMYSRHNCWAKFGDEPMTDVYRRAIWVCAVGERFGVEHRHRIGLDRILWESDFPHAETNWPESQSAVERLHAGVPEPEIDTMVYGNAARLLRFQGERLAA